MHSLFNTTTSAQHGTLKLPEWDWVRGGLRRSLSSVVQYYRTHPKAVASNHFLVRLLGSIAVPQSLDLQRYYDNVDAMALNLSMALKMTSSIYTGEVFPGTFYGPGTTEVLIASTASFDFVRAHREWTQLQPVKVLRHPRSDLGFSLPDGRDTGSEEGIAVVVVNIPMLAVQYRAFRQAEQRIAGDTESQRSVMQFVHLHVLPNMLFTQTDVAMGNRALNLLLGAPLGESTFGHPFMVSDSWAKKSVEIQQKQLDSLARVGKDFTHILRTLPVVTKPTLEEVGKLPSVAPTRQVNWALTVARLPLLSLLMRASKDGAAMRNQREVNALLRSVQAFRSDNSLRSALPLDVYRDVLSEIDDVIAQRR